MGVVALRPADALIGEIAVPGDKSVSHRSIMLAGLASTPVVVRNFLRADDCWSTVNCMRALGVSVEELPDGDLVVTGRGLYGLTEPPDVLDAGNSGTTLRLLTGILGPQPFFSVLTGDESLRSRPQARVIQPLTRMGCRIIGRENSRYAPLAIAPAGEIAGIEYDLPVASAQVKSAILLAGLYAAGPTWVTEPYPSRDHTENMLQMFGVKVMRSGNRVGVAPAETLLPPDRIDVPGDISSAAFWIVAASIIPESLLTIPKIGCNPTRTGIIDVLGRMGADISVSGPAAGREHIEPVADITVRSSRLKGVTVDPDIVPRLIDEIPALIVAAVFAEGRTVIRGAEELRVKETDRLAAMAGELKKLGVEVTETPDGMIIDGPQRPKFGCCQARGDHRIAMALAVAGMAGDGVQIEGWECVTISYPDFFAQVEMLHPGACDGSGIRDRRLPHGRPPVLSPGTVPEGSR